MQSVVSYANVVLMTPYDMSCSQPVVTGTSVLGIKYKDGIMMMADNLGKSFIHCQPP